MPARGTRPPQHGWWRIAGIVAAGALGLVAVCLVVFSTTQKQTQIGVLLGLWGALIAAFVVFGSRRAQQEAQLHAAQLRDAQEHAEQLHAAQLQVAQLQQAHLDVTREAQSSQEVELRRFGELQLARETAARREADFRLEIALRGEIERVLTEQIGSLRDDVAALRAEVVDKLGGELRMERIETTRVIGSDLEALQSEIRRLRAIQDRGTGAALSNNQPMVSETSRAAENYAAQPAPEPLSFRATINQTPGAQPSRNQPPQNQSHDQPSHDHDIVDAELIDHPDEHAPSDHVQPAASSGERETEPITAELLVPESARQPADTGLTDSGW
jgi:hypothetical protein